MNHKTYAIAGIIAAVAIASIALLPTTSFGIQTQKAATSTTLQASPFSIMGHITLVATDSQGNIKGYIQTDNEIKNMGENCVVEALFKTDNTANATSSCGGTSAGGVSSDGFVWLAIGTGTSHLSQGASGLETQQGSRSQATTRTFTISNGDQSTNSFAQIVLSRQFTLNGTATVSEAGIFDASASGNTFARQTFTGIPLVSGDKLTVTWTVTAGSHTTSTSG